MSNPRKAKGTRWENDLRRYLDKQLEPFTKVFRKIQTGPVDTGDIGGIEPFVGQAKAWNDIAGALREGVEGARRQAEAAGVRYGVALLKVPGKGVERGYAAMQIDDFARWLREFYEAKAATIEAKFEADNLREEITKLREELAYAQSRIEFLDSRRKMWTRKL